MSFYGITDIIFPNLGIEINSLPTGISVFGFRIAFYGITIAIGMMAGYFLAEKQAKLYDQKPEHIMDFALFAIIFSVIGARIYYVVFHWDSFRDEPIQIFNIRAGGLAIYGGVIAAIITTVIFCKIKKIHFGAFADVCVPGLLIGQIIGRWANFFNREAFGKYTDNLFAMQMDLSAVGSDYRMNEAALSAKYADKPETLANILEQINNIKIVEGTSYIQAHPTFLYESVWNLGVLIFILIYAKHKKFGGELLMWYFILYGLGRFFIEGLRTDQLFLWNSDIPISQLVSIIMIVVGTAVIGAAHFKGRKEKQNT